MQQELVAPELDRVTEEYNTIFADMVRNGPVYWDHALSSWVVTGYSECVSVLLDDDTFTRGDRFLPGGVEFWGGGRSLTIIAGIEHRKFHHMQTQELSRSYAESISDSLIRPIMTRLASQFVNKGHGDLDVEYVNPTPLLVGLGYLGFDVRDRAWLDAVSAAARKRDLWKVKLMEEGVPLSDPVTETGRQAVRDLSELFMPTILERKAKPRDDILSQMWHDGPRTFDDWSEQDVLSACWSMFIGGQTRYLIRNVLYAALSAPRVLARLRHSPPLVEPFIEICLRCLSPVALIVKRVMKPTVLSGSEMSEGEEVRLMLGAANGDPTRWNVPRGKFAPGDQKGRGHLAFGQGPRFCVGQFIARAQTRAAMSVLLGMTKEIMLNRDAEQPRWHGLHPRSAAPLNVLVS